MKKQIVFGKISVISAICLCMSNTNATADTWMGSFDVDHPVAIVPNVNSTTGELSWTRQVVSDPTNVALPSSINIKGPQGPAGTVDQQALAAAVSTEIDSRDLAAASDLANLSDTVNDSTTGLAATYDLATTARLTAEDSFQQSESLANEIGGLWNTIDDPTTGLKATYNTVNDKDTGLAATYDLATNLSDIVNDERKGLAAVRNLAEETDITANQIKNLFDSKSGSTITTIKTSAVPSLAISKITNLQDTLDDKAEADDLTTLANTVNGETVCRGSSCTTTDGLNSQVSKLLTALQNAGVITYTNNNGVMTITGIQQNCSCSGGGSIKADQ